ncbi:MAG: ribosomal-processing cysteine protease Prp [Candidatus Eremiobacteraeota bacterium]|nr:ribosomal-processing cysteine protease Prp [Candidatus Eremiobacteraeota bacterium]
MSSVFADGHADTAMHGEDVVCAAVSGILQAARLGLEAYAKIALEVEQRPGRLELRWPEAHRDDVAVDAIVATAELAVAQIAEQYPQHVRVRTEREA